jgi:hypothetical protein
MEDKECICRPEMCNKDPLGRCFAYQMALSVLINLQAKEIYDREQNQIPESEG